MSAVSRTTAARLCVDVRDDGQGFGEHYVAGVGIASMRMRAAQLGGEFAIVAREGGGTHVRARFPTASRDEPR
ncbi:hypothetical protein [Streptomyces deccanensis]|uniref:hypothetical protein n=1 Tax=Streptomyces deccanensis TaxID=424188 RepID=UPI001EFAAA80|nr:hypothetical protein [Streptomyces deccanensis]ULR55599.1 hypothetical protein L3078_43440 [Streptomyces deccanensis]